MEEETEASAYVLPATLAVLRAYLWDPEAGECKSSHDVALEGLESVSLPPLQHREHDLQRRQGPRPPWWPAGTVRLPRPERPADHADELIAQARRVGAVEDEAGRGGPPAAGYTECRHLDGCIRGLHGQTDG